MAFSISRTSKFYTKKLSVDIDSAIQGVTANDASQLLFSTANPNNGVSPVYTRSTTCWAKNIDTSPTSVWTDGNGADPRYNANMMTLISPRHGVVANHWGNNIPEDDWANYIGAKFIFVAMDNTCYIRTFTASTQVGNTDIRVVLLDSDLPPNISFCKVASSSLASVATSSNRIPAMFQSYFAFNLAPGLRAAIADYYGGAVAVPSDATRAAFNVMPYVGDSGRPTCFVYDNKLILLVTFSSTFGGPILPNYIEEINSAMTALGGGYNLSIFNKEDIDDPIVNSISIKKQNTGSGKIISNENYILNSQFNADNQYPIADGSFFFDNNYNLAGDCNGGAACTILTNYQHNSTLFYNPTLSEYNTFANRTFHDINSPYTTLDIGHAIQPRLLKMFGVGSFFGRRYSSNYGYPDRDDGESNAYRTITNTTSFFPSDSESWVKYGVEQKVPIPSWATKVVYGVKYLAKNDDLFRDNNFAGLKLHFRKFSFTRNYVNVHLIRRSTAAAVDTLESLYEPVYGPNDYKYFNNDLGSNATCQWLGPNTSIVKVRKRSSTIIDANTDSFIKIKDTIDIPTFSTSIGQPDFEDGRPEEVSLEMFFAEWVNYFVSSGPNGTSSGSIYFYEPFIYFV